MTDGARLVVECDEDVVFGAGCQCAEFGADSGDGTEELHRGIDKMRSEVEEQSAAFVDGVLPPAVLGANGNRAVGGRSDEDPGHGPSGGP